MAITDKLQLTQSAKASIKQALITKGVEPSDVFSTYPALIEGLVAEGIARPQLLSPMNGAVQVSQQPIVIGTLYYSADPDDSHAASTWEFASDSGFTNILHTSGRDTVNLESYDLSEGSYKLPVDTLVFIRVTYESQSGTQKTSPVVSFVITDMYAGKVIDGDIVVGQLNGYWIFAAPATKRAKMEWGLYSTDTSLPNIISTTDPNSGEYNTDILTSATYNTINDRYGNTGATAAEYCRNQLDKPYDLPNEEELNLLYQNYAMIDSSDPSGGSATFAAIAADTSAENGYGLFWTSTEYSSTNARFQRFSDGYQSSNLKNRAFWVAPVKSIPV